MLVVVLAVAGVAWLMELRWCSLQKAEHRELGPDAPPELGGAVPDASTNSALSESSESQERPPSSRSYCETVVADLDRTVPTRSI